MAAGGSDGAEKLTDRRLANLRPFPKGVSGNPSGSSKALAGLRALARANTTTAFNKLVDLLNSSDDPVAIMAASEILDRGCGRPRPAVEGDEDRKVIINIRPLDAPRSP
jgi:hypothetical protein